MKKALLIATLLCSSLVYCVAQVQETQSNPANDTSQKVSEKKKSPEFRVFPNPAILYFQISSTEDIEQVKIFNIIGKEVKSYLGAEDKRYDIDGLPMGMYLVQAIGAEGRIIATRRLSKRLP